MLYHIEVHWPQDVEAAIRNLRRRIRPSYSRHAREAARNDRYGYIRLPREINLESYTIIEAEYHDGELTKVLIRGYHDETHDILLALIPDRQFVKTVWLNERADAHTTLRRDKYVQG